MVRNDKYVKFSLAVEGMALEQLCIAILIDEGEYALFRLPNCEVYHSEFQMVSELNSISEAKDVKRWTCENGSLFGYL